jgi:hypothetical protein
MNVIQHQQANLYLFEKLKEWGIEGFINYGVRLGFFEDEKDGVKAIKEDMIPVLNQKKNIDDVKWLKKELKKYIAG